MNHIYITEEGGEKVFDIDELLSTHNLEEAFEHFSNKKDGHGLDGVLLSDLREYWNLNHINIEEELRNGTYRPGMVKSFEFVNGYGKRRTIVQLNTIDRFITRLLAQKMSSYIEPVFLADSYAYQNGKGVLDAVQKAKMYMENGYKVIVEIDIKDYFDSISLEILLKKISEYITDHKVLDLIKKYLYCRIMDEDEIKEKTRGILQGSPLSPVLSNMYLHDFDQLLEGKSYHWIRFADNIYVYTKKQDEAEMIFQELCSLLKNYPWKLKINISKSSIYPDAVKRKCLGYEFYEKNHKLEVKKCRRQEYKYFHNWHPSELQQVNSWCYGFS
jgi:group II intron reverse transcriptase/maturase